MLFVLVGLSPALVNAQTWLGQVVGVTDGDTLTVRRETDGEEVKIRLAEIDAPERNQSFGAAAKARLSALAYRHQVSVDVLDTDSYGRLVAIVAVQGGADLSRQMLRDGYAWCYLTYARRLSCRSDQAYAQSIAAGLWVDDAPVAPWQYRRAGP